MPHFHDVTIDADGSIVLGAGAGLTLGAASILTVPDDGNIFLEGSSAPNAAKITMGEYSNIDVSEATAAILLRNGGSVSRIDGGFFQTNLQSTGDTYKLVEESAIVGGDGVKRRWYVYNSSSSNLHGKLFYTVNAWWDEGGPYWVKDSVAAGTKYSYRFDFPDGKIDSELAIGREPSTDPNFTDITWALERVGMGYDDVHHPRLRLQGDDIGPDTPQRNSLYAASIVKAWTRFSWSAPATINFNNRYNIGVSIVSVSASELVLLLLQPMSDESVVIVNIADGVGKHCLGFATVTDTATPGTWNEVRIKGAHVDGGYLDIDWTSDNVNVQLEVLGNQPMT